MALTRVINEGIGLASAIAGEGTATTNLQQGLAKAWVGLASGSIEDSFNLASMTDNGTGDYTSNFSNSMGNATYSQTNHFFFEGTGTSHGFESQTADRATGSLRNFGRRNTSATLSDSQGCVTVQGDLA